MFGLFRKTVGWQTLGRLTHQSDEQLLRAFAQGKHRAFEALVTRYGASIEQYARRLLQNPQVAEEVTADTFEKLARDRGTWQLQTSFRAYLFAITRNRCLDELRRRKREHDAHPHIVQLEAHRQLSPNPEAVARLGELASSLETAIATLPQAHRDVVLLRLVHGLSGDETAQILGCTEEQVRSQLSYARKLLRKHLMEQPESLEAQSLPEVPDRGTPHTVSRCVSKEEFGI